VPRSGTESIGVHDNHQGIRIRNLPQSHPEAQVLTGNGNGIAAGEAHWNVNSGDVIAGNSQDGIRLGISSDNEISGNEISRNDFGIAIADGSNANIVSGNEISKNRNFGMAVFCGSDSNMILDNSHVH
jgi:parallel beta-helix repeat protein